MRVAIVEDEPLARRRLRRLLRSLPDVDLVGEASDGRQAVGLVEDTEPDVLLLDVEMPGMTGLQLLDRLNPCPAIIFVTAYEEYAVDAFDVAATDYVVKPVSQERLSEALARARRWLTVAEDADVVLYHRLGARLRPLLASEIECFEARGDYVAASNAGKSVLLHTTLTRLESKLPRSRFARIHRSVIVNLERIAEVRPHEGNRLELELLSGRVVTSSRRRTPQIRAMLR